MNVSPVEVERALEPHPGVEQLAVIGLPDELVGEQVAAVVVCREGASLEEIEPELKDRARAQLQPVQQPGVYLQIDSLPLGPTGKVRKAALRDLVIDRLGLPQAGKGFTVDENGHAPATPRAPRPSSPAPIDLSHPLREGMLTYPSPNHPRVEVTELGRHAVEGRATRRVTLGTHTGTHVDAPLHFIPGGGTTDDLSLDALVGPATVADVSFAGPAGEVSLESLREAVGGSLRHPRLILRYGWSERFGGMDFYDESPWLAREACIWLVEQGLTLLGMDTPSPDNPADGFGSEDDSPNHKILLGSGVVLVEYMNDLERLPGEVFLVALPLSLSGADGAPARVVAFPLDSWPRSNGR
jgi:kynurenine formamidase